MTPHGFLLDEDKDLKKYKSDHTDEWAAILGGGDFEIVVELAEGDNTPVQTQNDPE
jgi:hypothetical protein